MKLPSLLVPRIILLLLAGLVFLGAGGTSKKEEKYISPDQSLCVTITSTFMEGIAEAAETRVEIQPNKKRKFFGDSKDQFPSSVQKYAVIKAEWTPDSQFFVFSLSSEGRPRAWHFATFFFDRKRNQIRSLDSFIGPVSKSEFVLLPPDIVETEIWNGGTPKLGQIHLSKLEEPKKY